MNSMFVSFLSFRLLEEERFKVLYEEGPYELRQYSKVITWGDEEYPSARDQKLPKQQQELVKMRNDALEKSLETAGIPDTASSSKAPGKASKSVVIYIMDEIRPKGRKGV